MKLKVKVVQSCPNLCNAVDCSLPGSSVHGILQKLYWSWQLFPYPRDLPNPGIEPRSPTLQANSLPFELSGKSLRVCIYIYTHVVSMDSFPVPCFGAREVGW